MCTEQSRRKQAAPRLLIRVIRAWSKVVRAGDRAVLRAGAQVRGAMLHPLKPFPLVHVASGVGAASANQAMSAQETLMMREQHLPLGVGLPPATLQNAHAFMTLLPTWLPMPETRRHGHGQIALEWAGDGGRRFNVLIGPDGMLIYSARLGPKGRLDGAEPISEQLSPVVTHVIRQLQA
jgi:hypothetical protein